ncbi:integrin alpha [soil metagenome]
MPQFAPILRLSALNGNNGFKLAGEAELYGTGQSFSSAGDINGDGFDDLIIGASDADPNSRISSGASYVVFGKDSGFAASINLATLNGRNGFKINGEEAYDGSGRSVSGAGDFNGDGFDDFIIGSPSAAGGSDDDDRFGACHVVFGTRRGFDANFELSSINGINGFKISGEDDNSLSGTPRTGLSVSEAGDMNGDGFGDLIIGAPLAYHDGKRLGAVYVVFGESSGVAANLDLASLNGANGFKIKGKVEGSFFGHSFSSAGDVNGDGFADLIIGVKNTSSDNLLANGSSYVVFGKAQAFAANFNLSSLNGRNGFEIRGEAELDLSGWSASGAGDVNGDGFDDLIVGAAGAHRNANAVPRGASYVLFGYDSGFRSILGVSGLDGRNGFEIRGEGGGVWNGFSVSGAGDVNGDGFDDLLVGAPPLLSKVPGASYVVFGKARGFAATLNVSNLNGANGFEIRGVGARDDYGLSVSAAGDVNGDGFDDILIGALRADLYAGAGYVIFGHRALVAVNRVGTHIDQVINGGRGNDTIEGLGGDDVLIGWEGSDKLTGGRGEDIFEFNVLGHTGVTSATRDRILDFTPLDDIIDLSAIDARPGGDDNAFIFQGTDPFTEPGQVRFKPFGENTIIEMNTVGRSGAEASILIVGFRPRTLSIEDLEL